LGSKNLGARLALFQALLRVVNAACISFMLVVVDDLATVGIYSFIGGVQLGVDAYFLRYGDN
jgi:hypothetical protein